MVNGPSTFHTALPYAALTLGAGIAGTFIAVTASSTAVAVAGVALAFFGTYSFFGVISCGYIHTGNPRGFQENVGKHIATAAGVAISDIVSMIARVVLFDLINSWLYGKRSRA